MATSDGRGTSPALPRGFFRDDDAAVRVYLRPRLEAQSALPSARVESCEVLLRGDDRVAAYHASVTEIRRWATTVGPTTAARVDGLLEAMTTPQPRFAGLSLDRPRIMGIVNVTPDSFTDGGAYRDPAVAVAHAEALIAEGADIVDIGGESTRPGADPVPEAEELARVMPVLEGLDGCDAMLSIDTRKAGVMREAVAAGASIINDVSALAYDPDSLAVAAACDAALILTHMRGEPKTMNRAPTYDHAPIEVFDELAGRLEACRAAGIARARIAVDPGFGFAKTRAHNTEILESLGLLHGLGCAVVVGASGKWFGRVDGEPADSLAAGLAALRRGANILRVHDVAATARAIARLDPGVAARAGP